MHGVLLTRRLSLSPKKKDSRIDMVLRDGGAGKAAVLLTKSRQDVLWQVAGKVAIKGSRPRES